MTDLLSRPPTSRSSRPGRGGPTQRRVWIGRPSAEPEPQRPLVIRAAVAAAAAALGGLAVCMAVALVGWYLADAGAHGETTDALRVGADVWLAGHGSGVSVRGVPLGIIPLLVTAGLGSAAFRSARRAGRSVATPDDAAVGVAAVTFTGVYVVLGVAAAVLAATSSISAGVGRTIVGALVLAGAAGTLGLASGTGRLPTWTDRIPGWIRAVATGALATVLLLLACSTALVVGAMAWGLNDAGSMLAGLRLTTGDHLAFAVATACLVPNAVVLGAAWLLGPGFAVGTGTLVSPTAVTLGPVPAFPLLAALPDDGPVPTWLVWVVAVPVVCAIAGAVRAQRSYRVTAWDSAALRGFGSGVGAALLVALLALLAGGSMGTGRMADIGPSASAVLVAGMMTMTLSGLLAGSVTAWLQRRADRRTEREAAAREEARRLEELARREAEQQRRRRGFLWFLRLLPLPLLRRQD